MALTPWPAGFAVTAPDGSKPNIFVLSPEINELRWL